jgi:hypothetical protein
MLLSLSFVVVVVVVVVIVVRSWIEQPRTHSLSWSQPAAEAAPAIVDES